MSKMRKTQKSEIDVLLALRIFFSTEESISYMCTDKANLKMLRQDFVIFYGLNKMPEIL